VSQNIVQLVDGLPSSGMTIRALQLLDFVSPGQWQNVTGFDNTIRLVTGEEDPETMAKIRARAEQLFADSSQGYQRAIGIYQGVDSAGGKLGLASMAHMLGEKVGLLSFLSKLTPKEDTAQTIDLGLKLMAEVSGFCYANGFPGDGVLDFLGAIGSFEKENLIRLSAIVTFDGLVPLGPEYGAKLMESARSWTLPDIQGNAIFVKILPFLPFGNDVGAAFEFAKNGLGQIGGQVGGFASSHGITVDGVLGRAKDLLDFNEGRLDLLAAMLDVSTNYMEHTGIQSVARSLIERSVGEI